MEKFLKMEKVTENFLLSKGFVKHNKDIGWPTYIKENFELIGMPTKNNNIIIAFVTYCKQQPQYKYPLTIMELEQLYKIITNKEL